jgi:hypothetical protein
MGDYPAIAASKEANQTPGLDKATNYGWHPISTQEWM